MEKDYYAELELARTATKDEVGKAFRRLAAKHHPDRHPGDKVAEEKFKRVAEAYQVLSDPKSREAYDRGGEAQVRTDTGFHTHPSAAVHKHRFTVWKCYERCIALTDIKKIDRQFSIRFW